MLNENAVPSEVLQYVGLYAKSLDQYWAVRQLVGRDFSENVPGVASFALAVGKSADWLVYEANSKNKNTKTLPIACRTAQ